MKGKRGRPGPPGPNIAGPIEEKPPAVSQHHIKDVFSNLNIIQCVREKQKYLEYILVD